MMLSISRILPFSLRASSVPAPSFRLLFYFAQMSTASYPLPISHQCSHSSLSDLCRCNPDHITLQHKTLWAAHCLRNTVHALLRPVKLFPKAWLLSPLQALGCSAPGLLLSKQSERPLSSSRTCCQFSTYSTSCHAIMISRLSNFKRALTSPWQAYCTSPVNWTCSVPLHMEESHLVHVRASDFSSISTPSLPYMTWTSALLNIKVLTKHSFSPTQDYLVPPVIGDPVPSPSYSSTYYPFLYSTVSLCLLAGLFPSITTHA